MVTVLIQLLYPIEHKQEEFIRKFFSFFWSICMDKTMIDWKNFRQSLQSWEKPPVNACYYKRYKILQRPWCDGLHGGYIAFDQDLKRKVLIRYPYTKEAEFELWVLAQLRSILNFPKILSVLDIAAIPYPDTVNYKIMYFTEPYDDYRSIYPILLHLGKGSSQLSLQQIIKYLVDICEAIDYLQQQQVEILDLNPEHIVFSGDTGYLLIENAKTVEVESQFLIEYDCHFPFTPYAAPEQLNEIRYPNTNVYRLGAILYFILHGKKVLDGYSESTPTFLENYIMLAQVDRPPDYNTILPYFYQHCRELDLKALATICFSTLEPCHTKRPGSIKELKNSLQDWFKTSNVPK